jgi:glycosyltransferase involved in cell wall biosynthesis
VRICLIYDCLYPHTVGGAERRYRSMAERLAADGHQVTYLTLRQWPRGTDPGVRGVDVRAVGPQMALYLPGGRRRIVPPVVFGLGVLWYLLRHRRCHDVVHTASFPYFSLLAAGVLRGWGGYRLMVDWYEVWSREYWLDYLGPAGWMGWAIQRLCVRIPQQAFCFSRLHASRLRAEGIAADPILLPAAYLAPSAPREHSPTEPLILFAGRLIPEKRAGAIVPTVALARSNGLEIRASIIGDGPERGAIQRAVRAAGLDGSIDVPGFITAEEVADHLARALCLVLPSQREGFGLIVLEAAAFGTPSVVVAAPDNAATELIEDGVNGFIAASHSPEDLVAAIRRADAGGVALRESTAAWSAEYAAVLSPETSLEIVLNAYSGAVN